MTQLTKPRDVELWSHTTSGIAFEVVDAKTGESLTGGRVEWSSFDDDDDAHAVGTATWRKRCEKRNWAIVRVVWS